MKVGASHKWYYDKGLWRDRKITPEEWDIFYKTAKRRAGKAPKNSGAPVGTEYNWLIVAHQRVEKLDANTYMTCMDGKKFKVAHKRAVKQKWNIKEKTQRKKVIAFLEEIIEGLKEEDKEISGIYTVGEEKRFYGLNHKSKTELYEMAKEFKIPGRSKMDRLSLLSAVEDSLRQREGEKERIKDKSKKSNKDKSIRDKESIKYKKEEELAAAE